MGCGSSVTQLENTTVPNKSIEPLNTGKIHHDDNVAPQVQETKTEQIPSPEKNNYLQNISLDNPPSKERIMKHEPLKDIPQGKAFLYGQSNSERKIVLLDIQINQFSIVSCRSNLPQTPHKYQPQNIILQESQQMLNSNLFNKYSHPPYNFMFATFISDETIFLCGGVNYEFDYVSEQAFFYKSSLGQQTLNTTKSKKGFNLVGTKFQKLSFMRDKRYSHMGAFFKVGLLGYIYVFGGRNEKDQLLNTCEQYSIQEKKWRDISPMKMPRSTGFSLIFQNKIYVFGGYTGDKKRSKIIEVLDPIKQYWETLNVLSILCKVKIHRGIEAGLIFSTKPNQILMMGGNMQTGSLKSVIRLNLAEQTYIWDSNMKSQRLLQKGLRYKDSIFVFGGDFQDHFEKYTLKDRKWKDHQLSFKEFITPEDINSFAMASETISIQYDESVVSKIEKNNNEYHKYLIFGNDNFPCILQVNLDKWNLKKKAVPMALRLRCNMAVTKVKQGKYFLCGGIDSLGQKASRASYVYYSGTNKAIEVGKMASKKILMAICSNQSEVFIFGGRTCEGEVLSQCERFNLDHQKWSQMPKLPNQRQGAIAKVFGSKVYLFGGIDTLQNITTIDIFDILKNQFSTHSQSLSISSNIKNVFVDKQVENQVIIFSHNDILNKYYCHTLNLENTLDNNSSLVSNKIEQNTSNLIFPQQQQVNLKLIPFIQSFSHVGKYYFITSKGFFYWQPSISLKKQQEQQKNSQQKPQVQNILASQIVINQVQMLQFPIDKFSSD